MGIRRCQNYLTRQNYQLYLTVLLALFSLLSGSCTNEATNSKEPLHPPAYDKTFDQGTVHLTVRIDKVKLTLAEVLTVTAEISMPEQYKAKISTDDAFADDFLVLSSGHSPRRLAGDNTVQKVYNYTLSPFLPGTHALPSLKVSFISSENLPPPLAITSEPVPVTVISLLSEDEKNPAISDIAPVMNYPRSLLSYYLGAAALLVILGVILYWWLERRKRITTEKVLPLPPHIKAYRSLDQLQAQNLPQKGLLKDYYFELTSILRRYIEARFELKAPEQTTEEFLQDLSRTSCLKNNHKKLLQTFLTHCDLVKFARHKPSSTEAYESADLCRSFIQDTEPQPLPSDGSGGADKR